MNTEQLKERVYAILDHLTHKLSFDDINQVNHFLRYNEIKLALETLCEYIDEADVEIDNSIRSEIQWLCRDLNIDKIYWDNL